MILTHGGRRSHRRRPGYVLIAVLVVIVVLALAAYRFTDSMSGEFRAAVRTSDSAQARAAAVSGVHYVAGLLADPEVVAQYMNGDPTFDNPDLFSDIPVREDPDRPQRTARFSIVAVTQTAPGTYEQLSALTDEGGKLNINALIAQDKTGKVLREALIKIPALSELPNVVDAIVDWVDADEENGNASTGGTGDGAENDYYSGLAAPYRCKNGPLNSLDELLLVRGVTPQLLYGTDRNQNGVGDELGGETPDRGLSEFLTVYGREVGVDSTGQLKIQVKGDDLPAIYTALLSSGMDEELAAYIMAAKLFGWSRADSGGNNQSTQNASVDDLIAAVEARLETYTGSGRAFNSVLDLVNTRVTLPRQSGSGGGNTTTVYNSPLNDPNRLKELLPVLLDTIMTRDTNDVEMIPRLNVNTAPREVLLGLPGLDETDVENILDARGSVPPGTLDYATGAWLVTLAELSPDKFKAIEKYVTGKSMVYRAQSIGYLAGGGPVARVEAVIDTNLGAPRVVYFKDLGDLDSPRGFQPARP